MKTLQNKPEGELLANPILQSIKPFVFDGRLNIQKSRSTSGEPIAHRGDTECEE
jgi:hypothetical protein